jgi:hypothetical protein
MIIWDLCSGLGGWTHAFDKHVYRFDNSDLVQHVSGTFKEDVRDWKQWILKYPKPDVIVASPPCLEFSNGYNAPRPKAKREGIAFNPDLSILKACKEIIDFHNPRWWIIENVAGASKDFSKQLGMPPRQIIGPMFLWGYFPYLPISTASMGEARAGKTNDWNIGDPLRANKRAMIPLEVSQALYDVCYNQQTLKEWGFELL